MHERDVVNVRPSGDGSRRSREPDGQRGGDGDEFDAVLLPGISVCVGWRIQCCRSNATAPHFHLEIVWSVSGTARIPEAELGSAVRTDVGDHLRNNDIVGSGIDFKVLVAHLEPPCQKTSAPQLKSREGVSGGRGSPAWSGWRLVHRVRSNAGKFKTAVDDKVVCAGSAIGVRADLDERRLSNPHHGC